MLSFSQQYYKKIAVLILLAALALLPLFASAAVDWGVATVTNTASGSSNVANFGHYIFPQAPATSHVMVNSRLDVETAWIDTASADNYVQYFLSSDNQYSQEDISLFRVPITAGMKDLEVVAKVNVDQNDINKIKLDYKNWNQDGSYQSVQVTPAFAYPGFPDGMAGINNETQPRYVCLTYYKNNLNNSLGCSLLKKTITQSSAGQPANTGNTNPPPPTGGGTNPAPPSGAVSGDLQFDKLKNPLCATTGDSTVCSSPIDSVTEFIERILNIVIMIGMPIVVLALIWSGFLYVKAQGNSDKIGEAHKTLLWTVVGAALLMGSWAIARAIKQTVVDIGTGAGLSMLVPDDRNLG